MVYMDTASPTCDRLAYGIDDACTAIGVSRTVLYRLMADGSIPYRHVGGRRLIVADDLRAWLASLPTGDQVTS